MSSYPHPSRSSRLTRLFSGGMILLALLLVLPSSALGQGDTALGQTDHQERRIAKIVARMMQQHLSNRKLNDEISERALSIYFENLDSMKMYFLKSDIDEFTRKYGHSLDDLLPEGDLEAEAQVISWMSFIASTIHPARRQGLEHARSVYALADKRLGDNDWAVGGRHSIADIHLFRLFWRFRNSLDPAPGDFPNIERHYERMMARPAVKKTIEIESRIGYELPA